MAKFFVGQRVKKVRGANNIGLECRIVELGHFPAGPQPYGGYIDCDTDIVVSYGRKWIGASGTVFGPERMAYGLRENYEPILDRHEPCEAEFKESLDELLSREVKSDALVPLPQQSET